MDGDVLGGGVVVALAAGLWLVYLVPTMFRRREYLTTERNAVRLQQTLRILAETAEAPQAVRLEANARTVAAQEKVLRRAEQQAEQEARAEAEQRVETEKQARAEARMDWARREEALKARVKTEELERLRQLAAERDRTAAAQRAERTAAAASRASAAPRRATARTPDALRSTLRTIRRLRAVTSLALLLAFAAVVTGAVELLLVGSWVILAAGVVAFAAGIVVLGRLAGASRRALAARPTSARLHPSAPALYDDADHDPVLVPDAAAVVAANWTPQPLPKPLHLSPGTVAAAAMASVEAASELRRAEARAELERRTAELAAGVVQLRPRPQAPSVVASAAVPGRQETQMRSGASAAASNVETSGAELAVQRAASRFAAMGILDVETDTGALDLDAAFRRRAAV